MSEVQRIKHIKIKPCPFCGKQPCYMSKYDVGSEQIIIRHMLKCFNDGIEQSILSYYQFSIEEGRVVPLNDSKNIDDLIEKWNGRNSNEPEANWRLP